MSALFGTGTILVVYAVAARLAGRLAGLLAAFFLAFAVLHVRDSHFAATDIIMVFFCTVALWAALRLVERGDWPSVALAGVAFGLAVVSKYTGAFVLGVIGLAYFLAPGRPTTLQPIGAWIRWTLRGIVPIVIGVAIFLISFPWFGSIRRSSARHQRMVTIPLGVTGDLDRSIRRRERTRTCGSRTCCGGASDQCSICWDWRGVVVALEMGRRAAVSASFPIIIF